MPQVKAEFDELSEAVPVLAPYAVLLPTVRAEAERLRLMVDKVKRMQADNAILMMQFDVTKVRGRLGGSRPMWLRMQECFCLAVCEVEWPEVWLPRLIHSMFGYCSCVLLSGPLVSLTNQLLGWYCCDQLLIINTMMPCSASYQLCANILLASK